MIERLAISLSNVSLSFGKGSQKVTALKNISIRIKKGIITGLLGPDAAGKTTLMRLLAGLLLPDSGEVRTLGLSPQELKNSSPNSIGYMPQRFGLYEDLSVRDNLEFYARLRGVAEREKVFGQLLRFTSLAPFTGRLAGDLSGGMKQKLGIACTLLGSPQILLLDEPGVGVDPRSRRELWEMVGELSANGMTVVWSTSYLDEAARCPELIALEKGALLFAGRPDSLAAQAEGSVYMLEERTDGETKRAALSLWTSAPGIIDVVIRGNYIRLGVGGPEDAAARSAIAKKGGEQAKAGLEDGYMKAIGGIDKRSSPFAGISRIRSGSANEAIVAHELTKKFGDFTAAHNISLVVRPGEIMGLLGPNGAGKSTTFRMLCGLLKPTSGKCFVAGVDMLASSSKARNRLGYMAQKFSLYQDISVWENIYISGSLYGLSGKHIRSFGRTMAEAMELDAYLKTPTRSLPLGLKQRLALLCATLHEPPVLFLDEPTSGVDVRTRRDFWRQIGELAHNGAAVLVTTHFMEEAEYCDQIALIYRGSMIQHGTPGKLREQAGYQLNPTLEDAFIACIEKYDQEHPF